MIQLVNDILQLSSLDSASEAGSEPEMATVDLLTVAKDCVERQKLNARRAYISLNCLGESALVHGNRALLDELCQNLCDNAIRYNRPGGKVQITTACSRDGHCTLTVADNGIGIPNIGKNLTSACSCGQAFFIVIFSLPTPFCNALRCCRCTRSMPCCQKNCTVCVHSSASCSHCAALGCGVS